MAKRIYVGNMNYQTTEETLQKAFSAFGEVVSVKIITDKVTGRPKGFGFIEMSDDENAMNAINELNGKELDGRQLKVSEAMEKSEERTERNFQRNERSERKFERNGSNRNFGERKSFRR